MTKQLTAASILLLAERGMVSLDDPLERYLPSLPNASRITLRMLLDQTSGLHNYPLLSEHDWPTTGRIPLARVFAGVIDEATGASEGAFLRRNVFAPLRMTDSGYGYAAQERAPIATPYQGRVRFTTQTPISLDLYAGAGAAVSSAEDVAAWDIALLQGTLLDAASMKALWTPGTLADGTATPYAMGFVPASLAGHREVWHNGLAPGAGGYCYNAVFPEDGLAVVVLSNGYDFRGTPELMVERVLAAYAGSGLE
jgi:D-alanyl-D-alanine carboxypeptidase